MPINFTINFNELIYRGFSVTVFDNNGKEIDFLAEKDRKKTYVQVAYSVVEEKTWKREFDVFTGIPVYDRKVIITNDDMDFSTSAVEHIRLTDFFAGQRILTEKEAEDHYKSSCIVQTS